MTKKSEVKTNAIRILEKEKIGYKTYTYEAKDGFLDGVAVAESLNQDVTKVFKTLVTVSNTNNYYVCVIPVAEQLDLKKAAKAVGEKSLSMLPVKELTKTTGYIKGGCSPIGMKKQFPTVIDKSGEVKEYIIVSGGKVGLQVQLEPRKLETLVGATFVDIVK